MEPVSAGTGSRDMEPVLKYDSHIGDGPCKFMIRIGQSERLCCFQLNLVVKNEKGDLSTFVTNGEWHLLGKQISMSRGKY